MRKKLREGCLAAWGVIRRGHWLLTVMLLVAGTFFGQNASLLFLLVGLLIAAMLSVAALGMMGVNPLNPITVATSIFRREEDSWRQTLGALVLTTLAVAVAFAVSKLIDAAQSVAKRLHGDENLMIALVVAVLALIFAASMAAMCRAQIRAAGAALKRTESDAATTAAEPRDVTNVDETSATRRAARYWQAVATSLTYAVVALVPAALRADWALNVAASVVLPIFMLSVQRVASTPKGAE